MQQGDKVSQLWANQREEYNNHPIVVTDEMIKPDSSNIILPVMRKPSPKAIITNTLNPPENLMYGLKDEKIPKESAKSTSSMRNSGIEQNPAASSQPYIHPRSNSYERVSANSNQPKSTTSRGHSPSNKLGKSTYSVSASSSKFSSMMGSGLDPNLLDVIFISLLRNRFKIFDFQRIQLNNK